MAAVAGPLTLERAHRDGFELANAHTERFLSYIEELDGEALGQPVPGLDWTVGETIAHVQSVYLRYTTDVTRSPTPAALAAQNAADVARLGVDVRAAVRSIREQVAFLEAVVEDVEPDRRFEFHGGQLVTMAAGWGNLIGELLAHGDDIARATGRPFTVPAEPLELIWRFTAPALQGWLRPETARVADSWRLTFPFGDIDVRFDHGTLHWDDGDVGEPTHLIDVGDLPDFTLQFPYRRRPITEPELALFAVRFHDL